MTMTMITMIRVSSSRTASMFAAVSGSRGASRRSFFRPLATVVRSASNIGSLLGHDGAGTAGQGRDGSHLRSCGFQRRLLSGTTVASSSSTTAEAKAEQVHEFQAETRELLDIVARSLYSEKEVFVRELISNASDAVEKFRYLRVSSGGEGGPALREPERSSKISVGTDKVAGTITFEDDGIGMTEAEMVSNLGTIARSGSKAFMEQMATGKEDQGSAEAIIGRFGVGFYSAFMVADKIDVFSRSSVLGGGGDHGEDQGQPGFHWSSDGKGTYRIRQLDDQEVEAAGVARGGTKVVVHLKKDCLQFADEAAVKAIIRKYSSFVGGGELLLNGDRCGDLRPVWLMDPKEVPEDLHLDFYRHVAGAYDKPRFTLHFRTDAPMDVRALLYVPESRPGLFETSREGEMGVALYCRKVLIKSRAENVVPKWMRFVKGAVDSEDIPLNLSRELLQDSAQIRRLRQVITNKFLRFLGDKARKEPGSYAEFYKDYGFFLKEGIITSSDQLEKEQIAQLLRFESSGRPAGETVSIPEYCDRMRPGQRDIYYLAAPSRQLAEGSPYLEALGSGDGPPEVLFCFEPYDELVLMQLQQFDKKTLRSAEKDMRSGGAPDRSSSSSGGSEEQSPEAGAADGELLADWMRLQLGAKAADVRTTKKLQSHPCVVTVEEMAAARHFVKTQGANFTEEQRYNILQPRLEINPGHPIIQKLATLRTSNPQLASLVTEQLFANAMVAAGLVEDPRTVLNSFNQFLEKALEKH